ncbi:unnamed protein product, partial [Effrenium voratum]
DAVRAGHTDCVRLLAFAGGSLGDSATDEDRQKLCKIFSEDFSSASTWKEAQDFQRRMSDLQQRVSRLLVSVAKGKARPEVFDAEACTKFNRQLICAVFKQCPQLADNFLALGMVFRRLHANGVVPMQTFLEMLQDSADCMRHCRWWHWYARQQGKEEQKVQRTGPREAKVDKGTGMITKLMVTSMSICNELALVMSKASKEIFIMVNREVNTRRITKKDYVIDEAYLTLKNNNQHSREQSLNKSQISRKQKKAPSLAGSNARKANSVANSRQSKRRGEESEDPRAAGNRMILSEVCTECLFQALGWDVDWTAPASSNYGINAGAVKRSLEQVAVALAAAQCGAVVELWESLMGSSFSETNNYAM